MLNEGLFSSKNECWCTPQDFFDKLNDEFNFTLDPAATKKSAKCCKFYTPEENGLIQDWEGERVFCNPPYGRAISQWVKKGYEENKVKGNKEVIFQTALDTVKNLLEQYKRRPNEILEIEADAFEKKLYIYGYGKE